MILETYDKEKLLSKYPQAESIIKNYVGAEDYINGKIRFCLWIEDDNLALAQSIKEVNERLCKVRDFRNKSKKTATKEAASIAHKFTERRYEDSECIIIPRHTATDRKYVPFGYLSQNSVVADSSEALLSAPFFPLPSLNLTFLSFLPFSSFASLSPFSLCFFLCFFLVDI